MATRNRWPLLASAALPSALGQRGVDLEVVIVDDASADDSALRVSDLDDQRIQVVRHLDRRGPSEARNSAIARARGEWLAFLDDDDLWAPNKLRAQLDALRESAADFAYGPVAAVDLDLRVLGILPVISAVEIETMLLRGNPLVCGSNVVARAALVREVGGFDPQFFHLDDWDMGIRLARAGRGVTIGEPLIGYLQHFSNKHLIGPEPLLEAKRLAKKHGATPEEARDMAVMTARWRAYGYRRLGRRLHAARTYAWSARTEVAPAELLRALRALLGEHRLMTRSGRGSQLDLPWLNGFRLPHHEETSDGRSS